MFYETADSLEPELVRKHIDQLEFDLPIHEFNLTYAKRVWIVEIDLEFTSVANVSSKRYVQDEYFRSSSECTIRCYLNAIKRQWLFTAVCTCQLTLDRNDLFFPKDRNLGYILSKSDKSIQNAPKLQNFTTKDHSDPAHYASALLFCIFLILLASIGFFEKLILFYFKKICDFWNILFGCIWWNIEYQILNCSNF